MWHDQSRLQKHEKEICFCGSTQRSWSFAKNRRVSCREHRASKVTLATLNEIELSAEMKLSAKYQKSMLTRSSISPKTIEKTKCCRLKPENVFFLQCGFQRRCASTTAWSGNGVTRRAVSAGSRQVDARKAVDVPLLYAGRALEKCRLTAAWRPGRAQSRRGRARPQEATEQRN